MDVHPLGVQILSISCSFWENLAKSYVGAPTGELVSPPRGNPGSTTDRGGSQRLIEGGVIKNGDGVATFLWRKGCKNVLECGVEIFWRWVAKCF